MRIKVFDCGEEQLKGNILETNGETCVMRVNRLNSHIYDYSFSI